jgi:hypothetical protein
VLRVLLVSPGKGRPAPGYVRVYTVLSDTRNGGPGTMGDGLEINRFRSEAAALDWARGLTLYREPAEVTVSDVRRALAVRWGVS